jgi:hypothetical protein
MQHLDARKVTRDTGDVFLRQPIRVRLNFQPTHPLRTIRESVRIIVIKTCDETVAAGQSPLGPRDLLLVVPEVEPHTRVLELQRQFDGRVIGRQSLRGSWTRCLALRGSQVVREADGAYQAVENYSEKKEDAKRPRNRNGKSQLERSNGHGKEAIVDSDEGASLWG